MRNKQGTRFISTVGFVAFVLLIGIMVGASQSPIAGTVVTAIFGLGAAVLELSKPEETRPGLQIKKGAAGALLLLFVVSFSPGIVIGAKIRASGWPRTEAPPIEFPWGEAKPPEDPLNALDWVLINSNLLELGYSQEQIRALYQIQVLAWESNGGESPPGNMLRIEPLSNLFSAKPAEGGDSQGGLIAKEDGGPKLWSNQETSG